MGDVITIPDFQGRGLAEMAIQKALEIFWNEWGLVYAMLFCFPPVRSFYERMGWTVIEAPVWVPQPSGKIQIPVVSLGLPDKSKLSDCLGEVILQPPNGVLSKVSIRCSHDV
jgi:hypothetical protein